MAELVALDLEGGQGFVDALRTIWDRGDAACPLDPRLPKPAAQGLLKALRPTKILGSQGEMTSISGGQYCEDGDALVVATSGSTGDPKGVVLTMDAISASAKATSDRLGIDPSAHAWLACLPLAHIGGLSVITRAILTDTPLVVLSSFDPDQVQRLGKDGDATHVSLVRTALGRIDPKVFVKILLGGAAPPDHIPENVVVTYGLTESGSGICYNGLPLTSLSIKIDQPDKKGVGEVLLKGPMLFRCYRDGTDPRLVSSNRPTGWFRTGDAGSLDDHGLLHVTGRIAEVIVTGGEKVWPAQVEGALSLHPTVIEAAVWKMPDHEWGERVVAWIVPNDPSNPPQPQVLSGFLKERLAPWCVPKDFYIREHLPKLSSGKLSRAALVKK